MLPTCGCLLQVRTLLEEAHTLGRRYGAPAAICGDFNSAAGARLLCSSTPLCTCTCTHRHLRLHLRLRLHPPVGLGRMPAVAASGCHLCPNPQASSPPTGPKP